MGTHPQSGERRLPRSCSTVPSEEYFLFESNSRVPLCAVTAENRLPNSTVKNNWRRELLISIVDIDEHVFIWRPCNE